MLFFNRNNNKLLRHAIIGCGHIAPSHVYGCVKNNVELTACFDLDNKKAKTFTQTYKIKSVAKSLDEILNDKNIDSVSICTDHGSHAKLAIDALKAGKHVIVEKPIALNLRDAKNMISTAKKYKKVLAVISQHRYNPLIIEIKKAIDNAFFGKITLINASLSCHKEDTYYKDSYWRGTLKKEGGSALINQAIHTLDLILWIKGSPKNTHAYHASLKFKNIIETEDTLASIMRFEDKSLGVFSCTNTSVGKWDSRVEIIGIKGTVTFSVDYPVKILHLIHEDRKKEDFLKKSFALYAEAFTKPPTESYYGTKHREQMEDFFNVVSGKHKRLFVEPEEAVKTLSLVLSLYRDN